jgi:hypothetical protein
MKKLKGLFASTVFALAVCLTAGTAAAFHFDCGRPGEAVDIDLSEIKTVNTVANDEIHIVFAKAEIPVTVPVACSGKKDMDLLLEKYQEARNEWELY